MTEVLPGFEDDILRQSRTCLIPSLNTGSHRTSDDREIKSNWLSPFVQYLVPQSLNFHIIQSLIATYVLIICWVPRNESAFPQKW